MDEMNEEEVATTSLGGYGKPRKPREDTLKYIREFLESKEEEKTELLDRSEAAANVAEEIQYEVASIASHKEGSDLLEQLVRQCPVRSVEMLLERCEDYAAFLARHRHSSHVLQSLLALAGDEITETHRGSRCGTKLWRALVTAESGDILGILSDWNATHVARATFWTMAGLPVAPESRGRRNERHAHSVDDARALPDSELIEKAKKCAQYTQEGRAALNDVIAQLSQISTLQLQRSCLDPSAGPAFAVLLRVYALLSELDPEESPATQLIETILELKQEARAADIVYGLAHDQRGSVVLEAAVRISEDLRLSVARMMMTQNRISAYVNGAISNYVVQTLLRSIEFKQNFDELGCAILNDSNARSRLIRSDRSGLICALAETAVRLKSTLCGPRIASLYLESSELEAIVLRPTKPKIHEHAGRALSACLSYCSSSSDHMAIVSNRQDAFAGIFFKALSDPAPWSRKLTDAFLEYLAPFSANALKLLESDALFDLITSAETKHRAAPNPVARLFLPESKLEPKIQGTLLKTLKTKTQLLQTRAPAFFRLTRASLDNLGDKYKKSSSPTPPKSFRDTDDPDKSAKKRAKLLTKLAATHSTAALLPEILKSGDDDDRRIKKKKHRPTADIEEDKDHKNDDPPKKKKKKRSHEL